MRCQPRVDRDAGTQCPKRNTGRAGEKRRGDSGPTVSQASPSDSAHKLRTENDGIPISAVGCPQ